MSVSRRSNGRHRLSGRAPIAILVAALVILGSAASFTISRVTEKTETLTVTRVLDQPTSDSSGHLKHKYLVFTNHGTYKDVDSLWFFKYNSSDLLGQLQNGHTYRCKTSGFRLGFTSSYRNLISCSEVTSS